MRNLEVEDEWDSMLPVGLRQSQQAVKLRYVGVEGAEDWQSCL
jgi:hypothetical protein